MINNYRFIFAVILFFSFSYNNNVVGQGMEYSLFLDKSEIKGDDVIITLTVDFNIDEGYYIQLTDRNENGTVDDEERYGCPVNMKFISTFLKLEYVILIDQWYLHQIFLTWHQQAQNTTWPLPQLKQLELSMNPSSLYERADFLWF